MTSSCTQHVHCLQMAVTPLRKTMLGASSINDIRRGFRFHLHPSLCKLVTWHNGGNCAEISVPPAAHSLLRFHQLGCGCSLPCVHPMHNNNCHDNFCSLSTYENVAQAQIILQNQSWHSEDINIFNTQPVQKEGMQAKKQTQQPCQYDKQQLHKQEG